MLESRCRTHNRSRDFVGDETEGHPNWKSLIRPRALDIPLPEFVEYWVLGSPRLEVTELLDDDSTQREAHSEQ